MSAEIEVGDNIVVKVADLSIPARRAAGIIDLYVETMQRYKDTRITELQLYCERWGELDTSIRWNSDYNLTDHLWKGVKIIPWSGS